ncbi:hypothetical protein F0P96_09340 [Hymenobacter busanensis]|uniref:Uncharacterized protein n=1 Tax=Hymenobacter busanensis TaxID=2607656 RepID=A0A7L4ZY14_9BACT|nr:hypothetical protein [Hymenobacter busanensis]KAA9333173.1 hypothetical protein F0P96_09340 [Hymenobacter busanensis]QHJ08151.1 hypothetical protein GUY19_12985 [Hymenobacter busanensis]
MFKRYALLLGLAALSLGSCQSNRLALAAHLSPLPTAASNDTTATAVVLMHDSQSPEPTAVTVSASEAEATSAKRLPGRRR